MILEKSIEIESIGYIEVKERLELEYVLLE